MSVPTNALLSAMAALALVLGLVLLAAKAVRSTGRGAAIRGGASARLTLREALPVDQARRLLIVSCDGRDLLLLIGTNTDIVVGWLPPTAAGERA